MAEGQSTSPPLALPASRSDTVRTRALAFAEGLYGPLLAALFGLISALIYVWSPDRLRPPFDDSYISLTFARNLAEHAKLSFDGHTWSTGATSPLHVALLALPIKLGAAPIVTDIAVGVASHVLLCVGVYLLTWAIFRSSLAAVLASLAIAFTGYAAIDAGNGLETSLFMALVTFAFAVYLLPRRRGSLPVTSLLVMLAVLTRPEGVFLIPALLIYHWIERPAGEPLSVYIRDALILALPALIALGALMAYSISVSDTLLGTATAKTRFFQDDKRLLRDKIGLAGDNIGLFAGPLITLIAIGATVVKRREGLLFALFWVPALAAYTMLFPGGLLHYFYRYQHPILPFVAVFAGGGAVYLLNVAANNGAMAKALVIAGLVIAIVPVWQQYDRWRLVYRDSANETRTLLEAMVADMNELVQPNEVVATHDIGAVGYYGKFPVLDIVGLVNPDVIPYHKRRDVKTYLEEARPDYLLIFPEWDVEFLHIFPGAQQAKYQLVRVYPGGTVRISPYVLYKVTNPPKPEPAAPTEPPPVAPSPEPPAVAPAPAPAEPPAAVPTATPAPSPPVAPASPPSEGPGVAPGLTPTPEAEGEY